MVDVAELQINNETFSQLPARLKYNEVIAGYYENLADEEKITGYPDDKLERKADRLRSCSKIWDVDWHRLQGAKGVVNANLCRDKFCVNCLSALALSREHKFSPVFNSFAKHSSVYHCIFTVKNCSGLMLRSTIKNMFKSFSYFVRYLDNRAKIKNYNFSYIGYRAAVRSLEVTYNEEKNTYHPHLHCLMVFSSDLKLNKYIENSFSYSYNHDDVRYFSSEEVLFQKIWYLLNNGQKVNRENVEKLDLGYSVVFNEAKPEDYKEVFKYAFKADLDKDKVFGYEQFKVYSKALKDLRFIQGYGECLGFEFDDDDISDEELDIAYHEIKAQLDEIEEPVRVHEDYDVMLDNMQNNRYRYYTSGSIKKFLLEQATENRMTDESRDIVKKFKEQFKR